MNKQLCALAQVTAAFSKLNQTASQMGMWKLKYDNKRRRRFKQTTPLVERLHQFGDEARAEASRMPDCEAREQLLKKAMLSDRAVEMEGYLTSRELLASD